MITSSCGGVILEGFWKEICYYQVELKRKGIDTSAMFLKIKDISRAITFI